MAGIAGFAQKGMEAEVDRMLDVLVHRGTAGRTILQRKAGTIGMVWTDAQSDQIDDLQQQNAVQDYVADGHFARAEMRNGTLELERDRIGVSPLYIGRTAEGTLCFASEVKALQDFTTNVSEFPPGCRLSGDSWMSRPPIGTNQDSALLLGDCAKELRHRLESSVRRFVEGLDSVGVWLSGGLDSSTMASLARPHVKRLQTFAVGFSGAPDLEYAEKVAEFIASEHHEVTVTIENLLETLSDVIYHLESFDALLVRSSLTNYLVAQEAAKHVGCVLSGEGSDELFAGYAYLKSLKRTALANELVDITGRLHNTALQRVDRCASAHSTVAHTGFLDPRVVEYAFMIPSELKLRNGTEKWILRGAMADSLPQSVLARTKSKFWQGAGLGSAMAQFANERISDDEFRSEQKLPNGWLLNSKEELLYYRIFRKHFGGLSDLGWMGRTKGSPRA
jgi:asparagine synthase (glutamine-hydrolysing)